MTVQLISVPSDVEKKRLAHGFFEDFDHLVSADRWTKIANESGTITVGDSAGGVAALVPSDGTVADNDEAYLHTTAELFKIANGKAIELEARVQFAEANTDDANILVGLMSASAANHLLDNGAGPAASYSGAVFYKVDGSNNWSVEYSDGGTQQTAELTAINAYNKTAQVAGGTSYQTLKIVIQPRTSTYCDVMFYIDGSLVYKIKDTTYANATEMDVIFGVKNGDTNLETLNVDYVYCYQTR